jgi:YidC/Oxa1 family membrane protein insertase
VVNKYFTCILVPSAPFKSGVVLRSVVKESKDGKPYISAEAGGLVRVAAIPPGESETLGFKFFAGPKKITLLKELDPDASKIMKLYMLGMRFLEPLSRLMLNVLVWLTGWCGSYGLSIILLTLIVKTLFWPVTHRANVSMRKMQKLQPLMKEIRKKYKDNPQQMNLEMMKLYKEHNVSPLGGCLPILLQMPVFFALYATLSGSIEPRHTSFLWMHDLSMPDTVAHIFSVPVNPLMLMMTGTMILQQKLTPSSADPAQQKMMMFMRLIMLVMLYNLPSGLTLYWTVSQFISIAQLVVNKKLERRAELKEAGAK